MTAQLSCLASMVGEPDRSKPLRLTQPATKDIEEIADFIAQQAGLSEDV